MNASRDHALSTDAATPDGAAPVHLKLLDVAKAAKAAYDEGRLSAQNNGLCMYRDGPHPCAIGAALDDETAHRFDEISDPLPDARVSTLARFGMVTADDIDGLQLLQSAHDRWVGGEGSKAAFARVLNGILRKASA